jgi:pimeloyl-ACP methyl ester carboxylesterase
MQHNAGLADTIVWFHHSLPHTSRSRQHHRAAGRFDVSKSSKLAFAPQATVRTRRAYFDCRFGQLHVRTAFPTTGGFNEQTTLVCLHPSTLSSRVFGALLPTMADDRSVYAPDLPGAGESDAPEAAAPGQAAAAVADLVADLRLRQIDLLGYLDGGVAALELARDRPELVRRLVLVGPPAQSGSSPVQQPQLVLPAAAGGDALETAPASLIDQIRAFL